MCPLLKSRKHNEFGSINKVASGGTIPFRPEVRENATKGFVLSAAKGSSCLSLTTLSQK